MGEMKNYALSILLEETIEAALQHAAQRTGHDEYIIKTARELLNGAVTKALGNESINLEYLITFLTETCYDSLYGAAHSVTLNELDDLLK